MIVHDYECPVGHLSEKLVPSTCPRRRCNVSGCRRLAVRVFTAGSSRRHGNSRPTVYYVNKAGKRLYPGSGDPIPAQYTKLGYQRVEVQPHEIRRFERETRAQLRAEHTRESEQEVQYIEAERNHRHAELRHLMKDMDTFHKEVAEAAMKDENSGYAANYDPEFYVGAYS